MAATGDNDDAQGGDGKEAGDETMFGGKAMKKRERVGKGVRRWADACWPIRCDIWMLHEMLVSHQQRDKKSKRGRRLLRRARRVKPKIRRPIRSFVFLRACKVG